MDDVLIQAYIMMGRVMEAHDSRNFFRRDIAEYLHEKEVAVADVRAFGMYDDCGDSYREDLAKAEAMLKDSVWRKIRAEKHYKSHRLTFIERYPTLRTTLDLMLREQSQRHAEQSRTTT